MKSKFAFFAFTVSTLLFTQSCFSPQNVIRLQPEIVCTTWRYGQQFVSDSLYGVIFEVGFEQLNDNQYWFDFSIVNRSNLPVLIDPAEFLLQAYDGKKQPLTRARMKAIDPESEILELEKQLSKNQARELNQIGFTVLAATADIATGGGCCYR